MQDLDPVLTGIVLRPADMTDVDEDGEDDDIDGMWILEVVALPTSTDVLPIQTARLVYQLRLGSIAPHEAIGLLAKHNPDNDDAVLDESLEACRILGIDTSGDYDYLGTLRALVADRNKLREALSPRSASWSQKAIDVAPLLVGLCASCSADDRGLVAVRNGTKPSMQAPITDTQEGAIEIFLEEGPAAMVALLAERDALRSLVEAVHHQLTIGEASEGDERDIAWCARQLGEALVVPTITRSGDEDDGDVELAGTPAPVIG